MRRRKINKESNTFLKKYFKNDYLKAQFNNILAIMIIILGVFGIFFVLSSSSYLTIKFNLNRYYYFSRQLIFLIIGVIIMFVVSKINYKIFYKYATHLFIISIILLIFCYVPGIQAPIKGARRAIKIGITFMPSDIAKITSISFLAWYLNITKRSNKDYKQLVINIFIILIPFALIAPQTDLSTSLVLLTSMAIVYLVGGFNFKHTFALLGLVIIFAISGYLLLKDYQIDRIIGFLHPERYYGTHSFQVLNGLYAVTRGGLSGVGFGKSIYKQGYLANEANSDMIFAVISEELGFLGAISLVIIILLISYFVFKEALRCKNLYTKLLVFGIGTLYLVQSLVNIAVSLSMIPNTGINLPFISNGGTSLISFYFMFGIVLNISRYNNYIEKKMKKSIN